MKSTTKSKLKKNFDRHGSLRDHYYRKAVYHVLCRDEIAFTGKKLTVAQKKRLWKESQTSKL